MVRVQIRDAKDHGRVWIDDATLSFDPRLSPRIRLRESRNSVKYREFQIVTNEGHSDLVLGDLDQSRIVIYVSEITD
jgi:hypothetical protein